MMLLTGARRGARIGPDGASVPPAGQDRRLWDAPRIAEGRALLACAMARRRPGPFQIKAAIADCQMADPAPDWPQIALLYQALWRHEPTPVVALNAAVARAEAGNPAEALAMVEALADPLCDYQPWHAARAHLLATLRRPDEARAAYDTAIRLADNAGDAAFLARRRETLP
jgi:RNA polymerase sigma-70 factor (ECF subfamily)